MVPGKNSRSMKLFEEADLELFYNIRPFGLLLVKLF